MNKGIEIFILSTTMVILLMGCNNSSNNSSQNATEQKQEYIPIPQTIDSLDKQVEYGQLDLNLRKWMMDGTITDKESQLIKQYICCALYDSSEYSISNPPFTYREIIQISHNLSNRIDSLKQSSRAILFPFRLGESLTIPQIIAFGNRKDVNIKMKYRDVYLPNCTKAGNAKTYAYSEYVGNDLDNLKSSYNGNRKKYYWLTKDSTFLYKYKNGFSFDFSKDDIEYDTKIVTYGNQVMEWYLTYHKDIKSLYIEKYGEPLFQNKDTTFLCWDFKNIRIEIVHNKSSWSSHQSISFKHKNTYKDWQRYSRIVAEKDKQNKLEAERAAIRKVQKDSIRKANRQKNNL